jgi:hypothetical protein
MQARIQEQRRSAPTTLNGESFSGLYAVARRYQVDAESTWRQIGSCPHPSWQRFGEVSLAGQRDGGVEGLKVAAKKMY